MKLQNNLQIVLLEHENRLPVFEYVITRTRISKNFVELPCSGNLFTSLIKTIAILF